jgi:uncharacterized membrane protein
MSDNQTTNPGEGSTEAHKSQQTTPEKNIKARWGLGLFLVIIPIIIIFLIILYWPTYTKDGADASQKGGSAPPQQVETSTNTTGTSQTGNPDDSSSNKGTGQEETSNKNREWSDKTNIFRCNISFQLRMIILVLLCGALGGYIHMARSFSYHIGSKTFDKNWFWWYMLRMPIGAVLALVASLLIQGGVFAAPAAGSESQPFTLLGLAALVGMFSQHANEMLAEVFNVVFKPQKKETKPDGNEGNGGTQEQAIKKETHT